MLDTISYYDDSEPNWNERPFFRKVEEQRSRTGLQRREFAASLGRSSRPARSGFHPRRKASLLLPAAVAGVLGCEGTPGFAFRLWWRRSDGRSAYANLGARGSHVARRNERLARQLKVWALDERRPWPHLFWETVRQISSARASGHGRTPASGPGFDPVVVRYRFALAGYEAGFASLVRSDVSGKPCHARALKCGPVKQVVRAMRGSPRPRQSRRSKVIRSLLGCTTIPIPTRSRPRPLMRRTNSTTTSVREAPRAPLVSDDRSRNLEDRR